MRNVKDNENWLLLFSKIVPGGDSWPSGPTVRKRLDHRDIRAFCDEIYATLKAASEQNVVFAISYSDARRKTFPTVSSHSPVIPLLSGSQRKIRHVVSCRTVHCSTEDGPR
jgi:hypothetical protein